MEQSALRAGKRIIPVTNLEKVLFPGGRFTKADVIEGVQVYLPLNTRVTYAATQALARAVAELLVRQHPQRIAARMATLSPE